MKLTTSTILSMIIFCFLSSALMGQSSGDWTHFRGTDLNGIAVKGDYPIEWNDSTNVDWFAPIDGRGWSSPVVFGNQVWLTSASPDGHEMFAVCVDIITGEELFNINLFSPDKVYRKHSINSYATPTSAIEDGFVYVSFGRYGTACLNTKNGETVWSRTDMQCEHVQGSGSSLFLYNDKLIVHMEGTDVQDIYALDKKTGETIWLTKRDPAFLQNMDEIGKKAYVTPIVIDVDGRKLMISNGSGACSAYDVETGDEIWYIPQGEDSTISMPVYYKGKIYFYTSFVTPKEGDMYCELWAVDPKGSGDLTRNIQWRMKFPRLQLLTPVISENMLFTIDTKSELYCLDVNTGEVIWKERLKGKYNSSPIISNGLVYVSTTRGETIVFEVGKSFKKVSENKLEGEIWATPAFVNGSILMRTSKGLYKINRQ
ncbi:MAG: PQQ-binding-like beta-propeller repeat protein [Bacteroidales bacterium]|jgi:outer membrane protein assembly factor BamB|nr:PQQ-binding-like beta-propeller repeat protein [Bacteroidales bacterium]